MKRVTLFPVTGVEVRLLLSAFDQVVREVEMGVHPHIRAALKSWAREAYSFECGLNDDGDVAKRDVCRLIQHRFKDVVLRIWPLNARIGNRVRFEKDVQLVRARLQNIL